MTVSTPAVELRGLSKSFGPVHAVRDLDLTVAPGEIVAMLGPNGAGKSTTNEFILGLVKRLDGGDRRPGVPQRGDRAQPPLRRDGQARGR